MNGSASHNSCITRLKKKIASSFRKMSVVNVQIAYVVIFTQVSLDGAAFVRNYINRKRPWYVSSHCVTVTLVLQHLKGSYSRIFQSCNFTVVSSVIVKKCMLQLACHIWLYWVSITSFDMNVYYVKEKAGCLLCILSLCEYCSV